MSFNPIRSITLSNVFRVLGITLAICLVFGIADSGVSLASTPVVRSIPTANSSALSFLISLAVNPTTDTVYATNGNSVSVIALATGSQTSDSRVIIGLAAVGLVIVVGGATLLVALERRRAA